MFLRLKLVDTKPPTDLAGSSRRLRGRSSGFWCWSLHPIERFRSGEMGCTPNLSLNDTGAGLTIFLPLLGAPLDLEIQFYRSMLTMVAS